MKIKCRDRYSECLLTINITLILGKNLLVCKLIFKPRLFLVLLVGQVAGSHFPEH